MLSRRVKRRIASRMAAEKPTIRIGKFGVTDSLIEEVSKQLDARRTVKLKVLKSALIEKTVDEIANEVAFKTSSTLIEVRGHTFILFKRKSRSTRSSVK